jgi:hypothetical protein
MTTNGEAERGGAEEQPRAIKNAKRVRAVGKRSSDRSYSLITPPGVEKCSSTRNFFSTCTTIFRRSLCASESFLFAD